MQARNVRKGVHALPRRGGVHKRGKLKPYKAKGLKKQRPQFVLTRFSQLPKLKDFELYSVLRLW